MKELAKHYGEINLIELQKDFIDYIDVSDLTIHLYKDAIKCFIDYINGKGIKNPTRDDLKAFREEMKESKSTNTINSYLSALRVFFNYLEQRNIYVNITRDIKNVKTNKIPKKQVLTLQQTKNMYECLIDAREKAIFSLAITTGLRASEIANAKLENIKLFNDDVVLFVKTKMRDDESEYVKLSKQVLNDIKNYVGNRNSGNIFVSSSNNNNGGGLTSTSIRNIVKTIFRRFGFDDDGFSTHSLRRTCATLMYENGISIFDIKQVLHHKSLNTTQIYLNQATRDGNKSEELLSDLLFD